MRVRIAVIALLVSLAASATACTAPTTPAASTGSTTATGSADATGAPQMDTSNPDPSLLLTVADVQSVTGLAGLKLVEADMSTEAVGRLNFATADGTLVAIMNVGDGTAFEQSLSGMNFAREATGTGSMSYVGPSPTLSKVLSIFAAAQGDRAVMMKTFLKSEGGTETWLSIDQLQQLVGLALSRWK